MVATAGDLVVPRLLAHAPGTVLDGYDWDEYGRISSDGVIVIDRNANTHRQGSDRTLIRHAADGSQSSISFIMGPRPKIGRGGFYAFETLDRNAYHWLPNAPLASVYPNSTFSTPNPRNFFYYWGDRFYVGERPGLGLGDGFCINFWEKVMIFHQGRWLEAQEMGDATHVTKKGVAFRGRNDRTVEVWNQGNSSQKLKDAVLNKNFSDLLTNIVDSTSDGRVLIEYYHYPGGEYEYGWLLPVTVSWNVIPGFDNVDDHVDPWNQPIGGKRIFPEFKNPSDTEIRHKLEVIVKISPTLSGRTMHVKAFDVDDSTSEEFDHDEDGTTPVIDTNGKAGDDNLSDYLNTQKTGQFWTGTEWGGEPRSAQATGKIGIDHRASLL